LHMCYMYMFRHTWRGGKQISSVSVVLSKFLVHSEELDPT